jgi:hypothetical protein
MEYDVVVLGDGCTAVTVYEFTSVNLTLSKKLSLNSSDD